jgi:hypothetical protein
MRHLAAFFGKAIHSAVQKRLVNFLVNWVRRIGCAPLAFMDGEVEHDKWLLSNPWTILD